MTTDSTLRTGVDEDLRERAVARLRARRELHAHALVYLLVNAFLITVWALASPEAIFWPVFPMAAWGIGLVMHAWDVYRGSDFAERDIAREMHKLENR